MKQLIFLAGLVVTVVVFAGCSSSSEAAVAAPAENSIFPAVASPESEALATARGVVVPAVEEPDVQATPVTAAAGLDETVVDEQGAVVVSVTPLTIDPVAATLDFEVAMNTHSVDLSMDLATLATLTADTGEEVVATTWRVPLGGHHVSGVLSFPASSAGGSLLDGASALTLTLVDVDAPARTFTWSLK